LAATLLTHLVCGYIAIISLVALALFNLTPSPSPLPLSTEWRKEGGKGVGVRLLRLLLLLALAGLVISYFLVPYLLDSPYMNRSVWEKPEKYDSYGYEWVLGALVQGELFDFGRFPWLTILTAAGLALCLRRWREERYRVPVVLFVLWLLLYFGRPTWGALLDLLPMSRDLHLHRLIAGVHLGGVFLMGLGLAWMWEWALARRRVAHLLATVGLTAIMLYPAYAERADYLAQNGAWLVESHDALTAEEEDLTGLIATLKELPPGRVYAGLGNNWGRDYTVGHVPMYALLNSVGLDMLGYLYHALSLNADIQVHFDESQPEHYDLFNVRYVVAPAGRTFPDFVKPVRDFGRHRLYQVQTSGYFDLVDSDVAFTGDKHDFYPAARAWLASPLLAAREHPAVLFRPAPGLGLPRLPLSQASTILPQISLPSESLRGRILSETAASSTYAAEVEVERDSMLLLKATYHPGWHATVDGTQAEVVMVMPSYVGVRVTPGRHQVRLEYRSPPLRGYLMLVGLLTLLLIGVVEWRHQEAGWLARPLGVEVQRLGDLLGRSASQVASWAPYTAVRERLRPHLPYLGVLVLMTLLAGLPLFQFQIMKGHDALEYLPRQVEFYQGLAAGQLFPRWATDLSGGHGQPFFSFNPPIFYYVAALFRALGFSFVAAQDLALFALLLLAGLGMYVLAGQVFGRRGGLAAAAAYLFAPYLLVDLYVRHALADFSAFAFIPLAFWGLYRFALGGGYHFLVIGASATALIMLSSNPVTLMCLPALGLCLAWLVWTGQSRRTAILMRGAGCLGLGLALAAFFWLPALAERDLVHTVRLLTGYLNYQNHFVYLFQLFHSPWGYGLSWPGPGDEMSFAIGPLHLALSGAAVWLLWRSRGSCGPGRVLAWFFLALLGLAAFFASNASQFLWAQLPLLQYLQFPWRFLSLVAVSTAFLCGVPFLWLGAERERVARWLLVGMLGTVFLLGFPKARPEGFHNVTDADFSPQAIARSYLSVTTAEEYEPIWVQQRPQTPATEPVTLLSGKGEIATLHLSPTRREFTATIAETARLRLNTFYFPGWTLTVNGQARPLEYDNPQGIMEFSLEPGQYEVRLEFLDTPVRRAGTWLSLLALAVLVLTPLLTRWHRHRNRSRPFLNAKAQGNRDAEAISRIPSRFCALAPWRLCVNCLRRIALPADARTMLGIHLLFLGVYLASAAGHFFSTDHVAIYMTAQSLVENHSLAIQPINDTVAGPDGQYYSVFGLGQSLFVVPLYLLGILVDRLSSPELRQYWSGPDLGMWGGTVPIFFVSLFNQFVAPLICVLVFSFCRRMGCSARRALGIALMLGFGTAVWVYVRDSFQHPLEALFLLLSIYILFAHRDHLCLRHAWWSGLALALGVLTRINLILMAPVLGIYLLSLILPADGATPLRERLTALWRRGLALRYLLALWLPVMLVLALMMHVNTLKFGDWLAFNPTAAAKGWASPLLGLYGYLFSPGRSIFLYSPPIILSLFAWSRFCQQQRREAVLFAVVSVVYLLFFSSYGRWHGDWCWGPRFLFLLIPLWMIPIGYLLTSRRAIALAVGLTVLGVGVQILGVTVNYSYVQWDWIGMNLSPPDAYLFDPAISPIPTHLSNLLAGRNVDLRLLWVYRQFGFGVFLGTLSVPLLLVGSGIAMLRHQLNPPANQHARDLLA
jgi:hypothetical protein